MIIDHKSLLHLPVYTKMGQHLGKVTGFEMDAGTQAIVRYTVAPSAIAKAFSKTLTIAASQVVSIEKERMTVEDSAISQPIAEKVQAPAA